MKSWWQNTHMQDQWSYEKRIQEFLYPVYHEKPSLYQGSNLSVPWPWSLQLLKWWEIVTKISGQMAVVKQCMQGGRKAAEGRWETTTLKNLLVEKTCYKATKGTRPSTGQSRRSTSRVIVVQSQGHGRILESPRGLTIVMAVQLHGTI